LPGTWVSAGQWGNDLALAVWFLMLGTIVTQRARRLDVSWVFLTAFLGLVALRAAILGQSWAIWWHQLGNGALLLFAFFMISDPITIPNRTGARVAYAVVVALFAAAWQYLLFKPNALMWALFLLTPLVPLLDRFFPAQKFEWPGRPRRAGDTLEPVTIPPRACDAWRIRKRAAAEDWAAPDHNAKATSSTLRGPRSSLSIARHSPPAQRAGPDR
jgi:hypothetical protein